MSLTTKKPVLLIAMLLASFVFFNNGSTLASAHTTSTIPTYVDKKLGFSLQFPIGWVATSQPGIVNTRNSSAAFTNTTLPGTIVQVGVMESSTAASDFASRGKPTMSIGSYPAFQADTHAGIQVRVPCLGRIFLANKDTVIATWCSLDASTHVQQFETILATYLDHTATSSSIKAAITPMAQAPVNPVLSCGQVMQNTNTGDFPVGDATFGAQRVNPNDATWTNSFGEGVAVCDDYSSDASKMWESSYLFQCVELANRFINEEWGLSEFNSDAFAYYDYYQGGVFNQGEARMLFGNQVQLTDDASQGNNSALPQSGDLLVFQDVNNGVNWTSGEKSGDPGHVVVVTSVTSTQVNVTQENWYKGETWSFPISKLSNGYHIIDNSGMSGRITRGWIHFSANQVGGTTPDRYHHMNGFSQFGTSRYQLHSDGSIYKYLGTPLTGWQMLDNNVKAIAIAADGTGNLYQLHSDGSIYKYLGTPLTGWQMLDNNVKAVAIATDGTGNLYQLHSDGSIYKYLGTPLTGWQTLDNNVKAVAIATDGTGHLYQLHSDGSIYKYLGTPLTGWQMLDNNVKAVAIAADGTGNLYQLHSDGSIYKYLGTPLTGWQTLDNNAKAIAIAVDNVGNLYQLHSDGSIYKYLGTPLTGWQTLDNNVKAIAIAADGTGDLYQLHSDGSIYKYLGTPLTGWQMLDNNPKAIALSGAY